MFYFTTKKHVMSVLDFSIEFMKKSNKYNSRIHLLKTFTSGKSFDQKNSYEIIAFGKQQSHWFIKIWKPIILKEKSYSENIQNTFQWKQRKINWSEKRKDNNTILSIRGLL